MGAGTSIAGKTTLIWGLLPCSQLHCTPCRVGVRGHQTTIRDRGRW